MRLIYTGGRQVGADPCGYYVYLWTHGSDGRYVGRGKNGRWRDHVKTRANDSNQSKSHYFGQHGADMDAHIIVEGLASEDEAALHEIAEVDARRGQAMLLNDRSASAFYGRAPSGQRKEKGSFDWRLFRRLQREGRFAANALIYKLAPDSLKGQNSPGRAYFDKVYPPLRTSATIAEAVARGQAAGFSNGEQFAHMACDFCRGLIGMKLPDGETVARGFIVPTKELLARLALQIGTRDEWLRHCALRERLGCKIAGEFSFATPGSPAPGVESPARVASAFLPAEEAIPNRAKPDFLLIAEGARHERRAQGRWLRHPTAQDARGGPA